MPLEATMICMDNSEWNRNGDFAPSRWDSQVDAATIIAEAKTQQNPESTVGVLSMAGKRVELRLTQTNEIGDLINAINNIHINGAADVLTAVKVAQLSLKHRQNKSQRQRIVVFVGHPLAEGATEEEFEDVGMRLKKNNVSVDVINFANPDNVARLQALVNTANSGAEEAPTCHFLDVPQGVQHITDTMITSPILQPEDNGMGGGGGGAGGDAGAAFGGLGFDPSSDPELAAAMRLSLEEAKATEQAANPAPVPAAVDGGQPAGDAGASVQPGLQGVTEEDDNMYDDDNNDEGDDDEKALQEALALSMVPDASAAAVEQPKPQAAAAEVAKEPDVDIDADLMKGIIDDLGIDMDAKDLGDFMKEAQNKGPEKDGDKDADKKDEDKK